MNTALCGKRVLADMTKLRLLRGRFYLESSGWAQNAIIYILIFSTLSGESVEGSLSDPPPQKNKFLKKRERETEEKTM